MPIHRLLKEREGVQEKGRVYKEAVVKFLEATNHMRIRDAEIHASLNDLQFRHRGTGELVVVEAKGTDLSPNDFPSELARYYLEYLGRPDSHRFGFFIFAEELTNEQLWAKLFERSYTGSDAIAEFLSKLEGKLDDEELREKVADTTVEEFETFALDTHIHVGTYGELMTLAEELGKSDRFDYEPYLHSYTPIREQHDYSTNLFRITAYPDTLYTFDGIDALKEAKVHNYNKDLYPVTPHGGRLYSLVDIDHLPRGTTHYIKSETKQEQDFETWLRAADRPELVDVARQLLLGVLSMAAQQNDCAVDRRRGLFIYPLYLPKHEPDGKRSLGRKWLAKELDSYSAVRHRAVTARVKRFADEYYFAFRATQEFTYEGQTPIQGERKSELQDNFSPNRFQGQNSKQLRQIQMWPELLMLQTGAGLSQWTNDERSTVPQQIQADQVEGLSLGVRPPMNGTEQSEIINRILEDADQEQSRIPHEVLGDE